jgi:glycosyltransferase involved in cell wall biosynthesis
VLTTLSPDRPLRNVLHILGTAQKNGIGIAKMVEALSAMAPRHGYSVDVVFLGGSGPLSDFLRATCNVTEVCWRGTAADLAGARRFLLAAQRRDHVIVHQHAGGRAVTLAARFATQAPTVIHAHGRVASENAWRTLFTRSVFGAAAVIANSIATSNCLAAPNLHVIHAGVRVRPVALRPAAGPHLIGTAARLIELKGHIHLLRAVRMLRDRAIEVELEIAGEGTEKAALEAEVAELGLIDHVHFLGWIDDFSELYSRWHCFVMPSLEESFGLAAAEAMAAGVPVVASSVGGLRELVVDGVCGFLVPPADPLSLADRIAILVQDRKKREQMGYEALERIRRYFSVETFAAKTFALYDSVLNSESVGKKVCPKS